MIEDQPGRRNGDVGGAASPETEGARGGNRASQRAASYEKAEQRAAQRVAVALRAVRGDEGAHAIVEVFARIELSAAQ